MISFLSQMKVKLISYSQASMEIASCPTELVTYCARVSNPSNQLNKETSQKLIQYLINNKHWSPLEMVNMCLEITTTRDIARQILRHRSFSFQEFSQRYANPLNEFEDLFVIREARLQDNQNRQNSIETEEDEIKDEWIKAQERVLAVVEKEYKWAIRNGIAKEQARVLLPEGLTTTKLYVNGTLRSWIHYVELRSSNGTQKEHQTIAKECAQVISQIFPMTKPS